MKRSFLELALSGITCWLALTAFYSIGRTNEDKLSNTVTRANCSQAVASPHLKKEIPVDSTVVSNVIDTLGRMIETNCRRNLMESWIYPPKSIADNDGFQYKEREVSTLSREELRSMIERVLNGSIEYKKLVFKNWSEWTMAEQVLVDRLLTPISHSGGWDPRAFTDDENIAYYLLVSHVKSVFYAELRDAILMRETVLTNSFCPPLIYAIEVSKKSCTEDEKSEMPKDGTE